MTRMKVGDFGLYTIYRTVVRDMSGIIGRKAARRGNGAQSNSLLAMDFTFAGMFGLCRCHCSATWIGTTRGAVNAVAQVEHPPATC